MLTALIALGIFGTILVLMYAVTTAYRVFAPHGTDRAIERIQKWALVESASDQRDIVRKETLSDIPWLDELLKTAKRLQPFRVLHRRSGCPLPLGVFVLAVPVLGLSGIVVTTWARLPFLLGAVTALALASVPPAYLFWLRARRMATFARQLPEALELISRALRAGHALTVGLKIVGDEVADPIREEFKRVFDEISLGVALPQALQNLTERVDSVDMRFFVTSVLVQRETGGNLAEIIDSLAGLIRKRFELQMKVKALSAEGRFSAIVLFGLPLVVGLILYKTNPDYIGALFTEPLGQRMSVAGAVLMSVGALVMKRMVDIKV
jgi:tight adherence protein B